MDHIILPDDTVYLASYPRSGNTLLRLILWHRLGIKTASIYGNEFSGYRDVIGCARESRYVKTHELYQGQPGRHIYIEREWSAVERSARAIYGGMHKLLKVYGTHEDHIKSWSAADCLRLSFADLKSDQTLEALEDFTGCARVPNSKIPDFEYLQTLDASHFWRGV